MPGEDNRSGIRVRVRVPHRASRTARLGTARLGVQPGNRYASRHSLGRRCSNVLHELSRVPPVPQERSPLRNDDAHPLTTHSHHPHKSTQSLFKERSVLGLLPGKIEVRDEAVHEQQRDGAVAACCTGASRRPRVMATRIASAREETSSVR